MARTPATKVVPAARYGDVNMQWKPFQQEVGKCYDEVVPFCLVALRVQKPDHNSSTQVPFVNVFLLIPGQTIALRHPNPKVNHSGQNPDTKPGLSKKS